jgi:hypothetical protein
MYRTFTALILACAAVLSAQNATPASDSARSEETRPRRFAYGVRLSAMPWGVIQDRTGGYTSTSPALTYAYTTASSSPHVGAGGSIECRLSSHLFVSADALRHSIKYVQTTTTTDSKSKVNTLVETTRARYWDVPVRVQWLGPPRLPHYVFFTAGAAVRFAGRVRTGNEYTYSDATTDYNEAPTQPANSRIFGAIAGFGVRWVDEVGLKVTPEVRYTHWTKPTFNSASTLSPTGQVEVLLGFTF